MSINNHLSERSQKILQTTIKHYIATAEPVGSKTLVNEYDFQVSSATIRNILGKLEKAGFLYQPHISAGRIPSDVGYRVYVDEILTLENSLDQKIEKKLYQNLRQETANLEALLQRSTQFLADLSGYIALITLPQASRNQLRHLHLVQVNARQVMLIVVTDSYQTESILIDIPEPLKEEEKDLTDELQIISNFLNSKLQGLALSELVNLDWSELGKSFLNYSSLLQKLLQQLTQLLQVSNNPQILIHGISEVLHQPEFSQLQQVKDLIHLLEQQQSQLFPLVFNHAISPEIIPKVKVTIGSENPLESMHPCTLVAANYRQKNVPVGSVGLIGPTRMLYEYTIPLVELTADYISETLM